jgi:hypothetical protein
MAGRKPGTSRRRSWRKLHIGIDAVGGEIVVVAATRKEIDDAAMADALLGQMAHPIASFTADGAYDQDQVSRQLPNVLRTLPSSCPRGQVGGDRHLRMINERGHMAWQKASDYNLRVKGEASIGRYKRVIGDALRSRTDWTEATEVAIAAAPLNRMLEFGRPNYVRIA